MRCEHGDRYTLFCDEILPCVVGKTRWSDNIWQVKISDLATPSDEAFAHIILENNWDVWVELAEGDMESSSAASSAENDGENGSKTVACPKYTQNGIHAKRYHGWTHEGIKRFNTLSLEVRRDRKLDAKKKMGSFENLYLARKKEQYLSSKGRKKKSPLEPCPSSKGDEIWAMDDLSVTPLNSSEVRDTAAV